MLVALVGLGGMFGGLARLGALELAGPGLAGLVVVNVLGSGLLGALVAVVPPRLGPWLRPALGTGALGGFTTFSAAVSTVTEISHDGGWLPAAGYLAATLAMCVLAAAIGLAAGTRVARRAPRPATTASSPAGARR